MPVWLVFLRRKPVENRKVITEEQILARLRRGDLGLPPLEVDETQVLVPKGDKRIDALITLSWNRKSYRFGAEVRRLWTPKAVAEAVNEVQRSATLERLFPLVIVPYLSDERLRELEARGVSGIDLCGNGVVLVPGELLVFRTGLPNLYRWEGRIKNVYRGASAIVARLFLLTPEFESVGAALDMIRARAGEVTLPTVSKVCKRLEQDLVIERTRGDRPSSRRLRLLQPEKLLDLLRDNYVPPEVTRSISGKLTSSLDALAEQFLAWEKKEEQKVVQTGDSSAGGYAVLAREPVQSFYCSDAAGLKKELGADFTETERFANVRFLETKEDSAYFDRRPGLLASPVQTYLELATGEKREKETAEQVRRYILSDLSRNETRR